MIQAQAYVYTQDGTAVREIAVAPPREGEVLVRVAASGVCATDLHMVRGTSKPPLLPAVLGHEGAGVVADVGPGVTDLTPGDHVIFARSSPCMSCRECRRGLLTDCDSEEFRRGLIGVMADGTTRVHLDGEPAYSLYGGTLSEWQTVRSTHLVRIAPDLPLDLMCVIGCAVATGYGAVVNTASVQIGDSVLVVGCGSVGQNIVQAARLAGATTIVAVDPVADKLELARRLGATHTFEPGDRAVERVLEAVPGGVDHAFEAVGSPALVATCLAATRVGGAAVMVGVPPVDSSLSLPAMPVLHNRRLLGCRGGAVVPTRDLPLLTDLYRDGRIELQALVGDRLALIDVGAALEHLADGGVGRSVVVFPDP